MYASEGPKCLSSAELRAFVPFTPFSNVSQQRALKFFCVILWRNYGNAKLGSSIVIVLLLINCRETRWKLFSEFPPFLRHNVCFHGVYATRRVISVHAAVWIIPGSWNFSSPFRNYPVCEHTKENFIFVSNGASINVAAVNIMKFTKLSWAT